MNLSPVAIAAARCCGGYITIRSMMSPVAYLHKRVAWAGPWSVHG